MKKILFLALFSASFVGCSELLTLPTGNSNTLSEAEASGGIKEALAQGLTNAVLQLNKQDGFFKDAVYKVLMPPDAIKIENTLRDLGMGKTVDKAILQINRAAEDAAGYAKPIFVEAIKSMTISDAIGLIKNGDTSATHFFRVKTTEKLIAAFLPIIKTSLDKLDATRLYADVINPDLPSHVTGKAVNALFDLVAKEERNIRQNLAARTTDLLKKVFGTKW
jgi:hypothetical protein